jgi:N-acetyltransferase
VLGDRDAGDEIGALRPDGPFEGKLVRVQLLAERHREGLRAAAERDRRIHRYTTFDSLGFDRWFDFALGIKSEVPFVVDVDGQPVGSTRYLSIEPAHRRLEIGWTWLERSQWGAGVNVETKYLLLRHAFEAWGAMRVEFKTDSRNLRSRGALLGIGASFEGVFRKHMILPDSIRDSAWYAIVDDDWPRAKDMLEAKIARHAANASTRTRPSVE